VRLATRITISFVLLLVLGCGSQDNSRAEYAYVSVPQAFLRDRVAAVYNKVATVTSGQKLRILDRSQNKRFVKVRTEAGVEGWLEQRYLVDQRIFDGFAKLGKDTSGDPAQATAIARRIVNLHLEPERPSEAIYQIKEGGKVELLKRTSTPRSGLKKVKRDSTKESNNDDDDSDKTPANTPANSAATDPLEDWWLVRDEQKHVGWALGRMLDVEVPLEIAQYAEGQRIVAAFVLNEVPETKESDKMIPQYAVLLTEPKDGLPFDFNQVRIFTWNAARSRYETAYRERLIGRLPFAVAKEDFGKEGVLPTFTVHAQDKDGALVTRKYRLIGPIVRRVTPPAEAAAGKGVKPEQPKPAHK
jgi:hypothetical protein